MARITTTANNGYQLILDVTETAVSTSANTSTLSYTLYFKNTSAYFTGTTFNLTVAINGSNVVNGTYNSPFTGYNQTHTMVSGTVTVPHNSDGTKTVSFSCSYTPLQSSAYTPAAMSQSGSMTLTAIARVASFSVPSTMAVGSSYTATITGLNSAYTASIWMYYQGELYERLVIDTARGATSATFTIPSGFANRMGTASSVKATIRCITWSGNDWVGSKDLEVTITCNAAPGVNSVSVSDAYGYQANLGVWVQGKSGLKVTASASGQYGATISTYYLTFQGVTYTSTTGTFSAVSITQSGSLNYSVYCVDSRGNKSGTWVGSITVYDYQTPQLTNASFYRCNSSGTADSSGTYIYMNFSYSFSSLNSKNSHLTTILYSTNGGSTWSQYGSYNNVSGGIAGRMDSIQVTADHTCMIQVILEDEFITVIRNFEVAEGFKLLSFGAGKRSMAVGKVSSNEGKLELALPTEITADCTYKGTPLDELGGSDTTTILKAVYPVGAIYISTSSTSPQTLFGFGSWTRIQGRVLIGAGTYSDGTTSKTFTAGNVYGEFNHTLTTDEMPSHWHNNASNSLAKADRAFTFAYGTSSAKSNMWITNAAYSRTGSTSNNVLYNSEDWYGTASTGGDGSHNNIQPSLAVYIWKRTA